MADHTMLRITPEEVIQAYQETGLKVARHDYFPTDGCACGLGVMYAKVRKVSENSTIDVSSFMDLIYGSSYRAGFANGFDGNLEPDINAPEKASLNFIRGYKDGVVVWEAVVSAGLVSQIEGGI